MCSRSTWRVAFAAALAIAGCTFIVDTDGLGGAPLELCTTDCGAGRTAVEPGIDGSIDDVVTQADTGVCGLPTSDTFAALDPKWILRGNASRGQGIQLTPEANDQVGQVYWNELLEFARFDVTIKFTITTSETWGADGIAFAWLEGPQMPALGGVSDSYGIDGVGAKGYAIVVDTFPNPSESTGAVPDISLRSLATFPTRTVASSLLSKLVDEKEHALRIGLASGVVTVRLDGTTVLTANLPSYVPFKGYFSISAATGGFRSKHMVNSVGARVGTTGPCAAP